MTRAEIAPEADVGILHRVGDFKIEGSRDPLELFRGPLNLDEVAHRRMIEDDREIPHRPLFTVFFVPHEDAEADVPENFDHAVQVTDPGLEFWTFLDRSSEAWRALEGDEPSASVLAQAEKRTSIAEATVGCVEQQIDLPGHYVNRYRPRTTEGIANPAMVGHRDFEFRLERCIGHSQSIYRTGVGFYGTVYHVRMQHVVWGTAGHIDHGKTTLVKALTGTDCDRLPEEKDRGITIDLGFAQLVESDMRLHFVDVPGHERLVHTMIAGASGIDLALLVVAADEGVMPQTREHLDVIRLMGVPGGAVALTKTDLMDPDLVELVTEEIRELLAPTAFSGVPVVPVSSQSGDGVTELRRVLFEQSRDARPRQVEGRPYREPVDRVFSLTGAGTIVTGTSLWGELEVGSDLAVLPRGSVYRVRRLHVHGEERHRVEAGERVALNLASASRDAVGRGDQLITPGPWQTTQLVTVSLELLATAPGPLDEGDEVEVHALAARVAARIDRLSSRPLAPGSRSIAQISLRQPMLLFPGDRVILRRPSPVNTFAGGTVFDTRLRRWQRRKSAALERLPEVRRDAWPELLSNWIEREGLAGLTVPAMAGHLGVFDGAIEAPLGRLLEGDVVHSLPTRPPVFVSSPLLEKLAAEAARELERRFAGEEVSAGVPARDFAGALLPRSALSLADHYLEELRGRGVIELSEGRVVPPGRESYMTEAGEALARKVEALYRAEGFAAPSPAEVAELLQAKVVTVEGICRYLIQRGRLVRLEGKYLIHRAVLEEMVRELHRWGVEEFGVGDFKQRFGLTRKLAIPALEWLDSERVTVRHGNRRKIMRRK